MKRIVCLSLLIGAFALVQCGRADDLLSAAAPDGGSLQTTDAAPVSATGYSVVERGPHHRVWQRTEITTNRFGHAVLHKHSYTELQSGMHRLEGGQWVDATPQVVITTNGATGAGAAHQVSFPSDVTDGIVLNTPDGLTLRSRVMGLAYFDYQSGQHVLIAELTNSVGLLAGSDTVVYTNAFTDFAADVAYTYTAAGFEQNVILRERPPLPEEFGLNPDSTRLELITEFFDPPQPVRYQNLRKRWLVAKEDQLLDFGAMKIGYGRAFGTQAEGSHLGFTVDKQWVTSDGRTFLVEDVGFRWIKPHLRPLALPGHASIRRSPDGALYVVSTNRLLPRLRMAQARPAGRIQLASAKLQRPGFEIDWSAVNASTNYLFQSDTTYYVSGTVNLAGTNIMEGGTVIKFSTNAELNVLGAIVAKTDMYRPTFLTAKDDDTVGAHITGSTGTPNGRYASVALSLQNGGDLSNLRILYARQAIYSPHDYTIRHAQIIHCGWGLVTENANFTALNLLMTDVGTNFYGRFYHGTAQHLTSHLASRLTDDWEFTYYSGGVDCGTYTPSSSVSLVNSLTVCLTNGYGIVPVSTDHTTDLASDSGIFQNAAAAGHYLADASPYRDAGTTSGIDTGLLADLSKRTTWPPIVYSNSLISADTALSPQAQRDTDTPDLGFHYSPMDFAFKQTRLTNCTVRVAPGTAVGTLGSGQYGLAATYGSSILCAGSATNPVRILRYNLVQEEANAGWAGEGDSIIGDFLSTPGTGQAAFTFTDWSMPAQDGSHFSTEAQDRPDSWFGCCQFHGGKFWVTEAAANFTNCLFERVLFYLSDDNADISPAVQSCLFFGGQFQLSQSDVGETWTFRDNLFDGATITQLLLGDPIDPAYDGYTTGSDRLEPTNAYDVISTLAWVPGPLGNYYQPTNSAFINKGSTNADAVGLYHYTVTTNLVAGLEVKETNSVVDLGFHYVAVDANGNPIDSDGDGIADYLEDANGNGIATDDPTSWTNYDSPNGLTMSAGLQVFTPLK